MEHILKPRFQQITIKNLDDRSRKERLGLEKMEVQEKIKLTIRKRERIKEFRTGFNQVTGMGTWTVFPESNRIQSIF